MLPLVDEVIHDDCLAVLDRVRPGTFDLAYLDPPFNTGRTLSASRAAYRDTWPGLEAYLAFLRRRLEGVHRALKPAGSILLHCDWRCVHHLRFVLDELFGVSGFINDLVWSYGLGGSSPRRFARKHDDILFYAKRGDYYFKPPMVPATSARMKGRMKKASDVIRIPAINNMALERTGYPTQKPLALLSMLVNACCPPGGLVLDPFCGSGTTLVAAAESGRSFLGIDANRDAVRIARSRLASSLSPSVP
jgi:site-specific DNA-methyltransferase (adenine-specific)